MDLFIIVVLVLLKKPLNFSPEPADPLSSLLCELALPEVPDLPSAFRLSDLLGQSAVASLSGAAAKRPRVKFTALLDFLFSSRSVFVVEKSDLCVAENRSTLALPRESLRPRL